MKEFIARRTYNVLNNMVTMCMNHMKILSAIKKTPQTSILMLHVLGKGLLK
jgi:hypothetical protein